MNQTTKQSSTGGVITYLHDKQGNQIGLVHKTGSAYSGKIGQDTTLVNSKKSY